jgi:hypothetical protein
MVASLFPEEDTADTSPARAHKRSYKVVPSPPMRSSYAKEIARQYGVSFEQLRSMLSERGVLDTEILDRN